MSDDCGRRSAALLLSLWALFLLSAVVISWALNIDSRLTLNGNANRVMEAEAMAASGSEIAMHPAVKPGSPLLRGGVSRTQTFDARITGEAGRLNLRYLLAGEEKLKLDFLRQYLEVKGVELNDRERMVDCLLDWVDPGNEVRLNGAEADGDYQPPNRMITQIEELRRVRGWEKFTSVEGWDSDLTVNSAGPIDVRWASRDVLLALPTMTAQRVDAFLTLRQGADGVDGTEDDPTVTPDVANAALGIGRDASQALAPLIAGYGDTTFRIISVGRSGDVSRTIQMVIRKAANGGASNLISWKEL